jgi:ADP-ribose pyrophosphatase YjhB (NUDIX family)
MIRKYYTEHAKIYVAVDCIIFGWDDSQLKLLILKRNFEPAKGKNSLIGGFVRENESLDEAARRILYELTGLTDIYLEQLNAYGEVVRDPGERTISVAYFALLKIQNLDSELIKKHGAHWVPLSKLPKLIFDHNQMVQKAIRRLRRRAKSEPTGFELLPRKFTLPQLQGLYEEIYQTSFDNRNFRKKVLSMNILKKLNEKDKSTSKKGAYYYKFDRKKYYHLLQNGFHFDI